MSKLTIEKDIEFIKNQVNYLLTFQKKINNAFTDLKSFSTYWKGPGEEEAVYTEISRWLKCYQQLKAYLSDKEVIDAELNQQLKELPSLTFVKPVDSKEEISKAGGGKKFMYTVLPPYRISFNKKKVKAIESQIVDYKLWVDRLRKLSYQIESVYTDGI